MGPVTPQLGLRVTSVSPQPAQGGDILCEGGDGRDFVTSGFLFLFCRREEERDCSELGVLRVALSPCPAVPMSMSQPYLAEECAG